MPTRAPAVDRRRRALLAALPGFALVGSLARAADRAAATPVVPIVDRLTLHIVVDAQVFAFAEPVQRPDLTVDRAGPRGLDAGAPDGTLTAEFGFSMLADSHRGDEARRVLIDTGYSPQTIANNLQLLRLDPATFDALVVSHGHYDHFGGLVALLSGDRPLRRGTPVYVGGEEIFCARETLVKNVQLPFGRLDREAILAAGLRIESSLEPSVVAGHAFTTGRIPLVTTERTVNPTLMRPGVGCERALLEADKRDLTIVPDDLRHEIATAWVVKDRGLVVSSSCSHRGVLNAIRRAQQISGVQHVHAVIGGFHLVWPRTEPEALETAAELEKVAPDYVIPMHCTGERFVSEALRRFPTKVVRPYVGSRFNFGAGQAQARA